MKRMIFIYSVHLLGEELGQWRLVTVYMTSFIRMGIQRQKLRRCGVSCTVCHLRGRWTGVLCWTQSMFSRTLVDNPTYINQETDYIYRSNLNAFKSRV